MIVNAEDLKDTDFACARNSDSGYSENLAFTYDSGNKSLTIHRSDDSSMNITGIRSIHFGQNGKDLNLCDPPTQFYKVKDGKTPDLSKNTVSIELESLTPNSVRDITLTMSVLQTKVVNVHYTFSNITGLDHAPFEVPTEVINNTTPLSTSEVLSNFVKVELDD